MDRRRRRRKVAVIDLMASPQVISRSLSPAASSVRAERAPHPHVPAASDAGSNWVTEREPFGGKPEEERRKTGIKTSEEIYFPKKSTQSSETPK